jgi:hypothetical protein
MSMMAAWLLRLYPADWRERYGDEFAALLDDCQLSLAVLFDLFCGALDAHMSMATLTGRIVSMIDRTRRAEITVFCAWAVFVVAGLLFQKLTEYDDFMNASHTYPIIGVSYVIVGVGAVAALLAVLAGGLPLALSAFGRALAARRGGVLLLFGVPVLVLGVLAAYLYTAGQILSTASAPNQAPTPQGKALFLGLIVVFFMGAIASAVGVSAAISRSEVDAHWYRFARVPALVTALAMLVMCVATIVWGLALRADVPELFNGDDGIVATNTGLSWLIIVIIMVIATLMALAPLFLGSSERIEPSTGTPAAA